MVHGLKLPHGRQRYTNKHITLSLYNSRSISYNLLSAPFPSPVRGEQLPGPIGQVKTAPVFSTAAPGMLCIGALTTILCVCASVYVHVCVRHMQEYFKECREKINNQNPTYYKLTITNQG